MNIFKAFNTKFHFLVQPADEIITVVCDGDDVFHALSKLMTRWALDEIAMRPALERIIYVGSVDGRKWASVPVGPAYRQCNAQAQAIVRRFVVDRHGKDAERFLTEFDLEWFAQHRSAS